MELWRVRHLSWRLALMAVVIVVALVVALGAAAQEADLNAEFRSAITAFNEGRYQPAIDGFTTVIDNAGDALTEAALGNVHWRRGSAYHASGADLQALGDFTAA
ncbi:MAG: hypothetical protein O7A03_03505, partial [Alphaproteobacteria bacterium]|nr:hypothetical protein [Alphaproteobacteria bacterium]